MRNMIGILILGYISFSCQPPNNLNQEKSIIINLAIDSALKLDPGLNSTPYWIDFSKVQYFDRQSIESFFKHRQNFTEVNADSLIKIDSTWVKYGFLQKMLIKFKNLQIKGDSIFINIDKIKAMDGSNGIEIIIKKENNNYQVISSRITWIS